jgi:hypothetical protein
MDPDPEEIFTDQEQFATIQLSLPSDTKLFGIWMSTRVADSAWLRIAELTILHLAMPPPLFASVKINKNLTQRLKLAEQTHT